MDDFEGKQICGFREGIHSEIGAVRGWRFPEVDIYIRQYLPGWTGTQMKDAFREVAKNWNEVCGIDLRVIDEPQASRKGLIIVVDVSNIDGQSGTLAWSELANKGTRRVQQMYDRSERFVISLKPQRSEIGLIHVGTHETGHALGMDHIPAARARALLNPLYSAAIFKPQPADIKVVQGYYGPPIKVSVPVPDVPKPKEPDAPNPSEPPTPKNPSGGINMDKIVALLKEYLAETWEKIKPILIESAKKKLNAETVTALLMPIIEAKFKDNKIALRTVKFVLPLLISAFTGTDSEKAQVLALVAPELDPAEVGLA